MTLPTQMRIESRMRDTMTITTITGHLVGSISMKAFVQEYALYLLAVSL